MPRPDPSPPRPYRVPDPPPPEPQPPGPTLAERWGAQPVWTRVLAPLGLFLTAITTIVLIHGGGWRGAATAWGIGIAVWALVWGIIIVTWE